MVILALGTGILTRYRKQALKPLGYSKSLKRLRLRDEIRWDSMEENKNRHAPPVDL